MVDKVLYRRIVPQAPRAKKQAGQPSRLANRACGPTARAGQRAGRITAKKRAIDASASCATMIGWRL
jgi:hypothetical protein